MRVLIVDDSSIRFAFTTTLRRARTTRVRRPWPTSRTDSHPYGFGCAADSANLLDDQVCTKVGLNDAWLADLDKRAPGLFQVARQIVA